MQANVRFTYTFATHAVVHDSLPPTAKMKLNISYPANGSQKLIEVDDDRKLRVFMEKRMGNEVPADSLGDEWKGYVCC